MTVSCIPVGVGARESSSVRYTCVYSSSFCFTLRVLYIYLGFTHPPASKRVISAWIP